MPTAEQLNTAHINLTGILEWYRDLNVDALKRTELGEKLSFEAGMPYFQRVVSLYRNLLSCDLTDISYSKKTQIFQAGQSTKTVLEKIAKFEVGQENPLNQRTTLIQEVLDRWEQDFDVVTPVLAYGTKSSADFQRLEREARGTLADLKEIKIGIEKEAEMSRASATAALAEVQEAARKAGISLHAARFSEETKLYTYVAAAWLIATIAAGCGVIWYVVNHLEPLLKELIDPTWTQLVHQAIPRLIVLFVLMFAMIWSSRNFNASIHNIVVNRHRGAALSTFNTFVAGTENPETKDAVLIQATHAIFTPQDSGYAKGEVPNPASQVVEVFRGGGKAAG